MSKGLTIIDKDYTQWVENLSVRYRQTENCSSIIGNLVET